MIQEEKTLLLQDLCGRLPYGVIVYDYDREETREMGFGTLHDIMFNDLECKPYLRPMSSMTEEEVLEYIGLKENIVAIDDITYSFETYKSIDWLNSRHFDYRGLIEKGLALEAPKGIYEKKKE